MTAVISEKQTNAVAYTMHCLDHTGDSEFSWDPQNPDDVDEAKKHFDGLRAKGYLMYKVDGDNREQIREFDLEASRVVGVPQLQGG